MVTKAAHLIAAMDHSPSEQLIGDPDAWHTTALIASEGNEHWDLAAEIAKLVNDSSKLSRWAGRKAPYKQKFREALRQTMPKYPVYVRAIAARERVIEGSSDHMIRELGLHDHVNTFAKNGKPYVRIGPVLKGRYGLDIENFEQVNFDVHLKQALPVIFICHFVLRMHQQLLSLLQKVRPRVEWLDLQLMPNKFPGDVHGRMALLFDAIIKLASNDRIAGNIRMMTLLESGQDFGNLFADNVAGLMREKIEAGDPESLQLSIKGMDWEILSD